MKSMEKTILIYKDNGVSIPSYLSTQWMLMGLPYSITSINAEQLTHSDWEHNTAAIFFPGGRDIPYHDALQGKANERIRQFVENGGHYYGICAGAYYGSKTIEFEKGLPNEVLASRELQFFEGKAIGTIFGPFSYGSECGACKTEITLGNESHSIYYNGGCYFEIEPNQTGVEVVGSYKEHHNQAAIIQCEVGKGQATLSGVHYEFPSKEYRQLINRLLKHLL